VFKPVYAVPPAGRPKPPPGHVHVRFERAGDVGHLTGESLDEAQVDRRRLDVQIDRVARGLGDVAAARTRLEQGRRHAALRRDRFGRRLLQRRIDGARVVHVGDERLVFVGLERSVSDLDPSIDRRRLRRARDRRVR
jgi:hypothetical protein